MNLNAGLFLAALATGLLLALTFGWSSRRRHREEAEQRWIAAIGRFEKRGRK